MATYVLVHGTFSGGWVWKPVATLLREAGHEMFRPTLTGLGERAHLAHRGIDLDTHIQDVIGVLEYEELSEVILVGHSSGSMVITGVAEQTPQRVRHLVYLDTVVPGNGQSWLQLLGPEVSSRLLRLARVEGDGWRLPPPPPQCPKYCAHPLRALTQPVKVGNPDAADIPRTFIHCTAKSDDDPFNKVWAAIADAAARAREAGWRYREMATGHEPMVTMPKKLAGVLLEVA